MHKLLKSWLKFISYGSIDEEVDSLVASSWFKSRELGIDPNGEGIITRYSNEELNKSIEKNSGVITIIDSYVGVLLDNITPNTKVLVNYYDKNCYLIKQWDKNIYMKDTRNLNLYPGVCWKSQYMGTNGPGEAHRYRRSVIIEGYEHYIRKYHDIVQISSPIMDSIRNVVGIIDITLPKGQFIVSLYRTLALLVHGVERELKHMKYISEDSGNGQGSIYESIDDILMKKKFRKLIAEDQIEQKLLKGLFDQPYIGVAYYKHPDKSVVDVNKKYLSITRDIFNTDDIKGLVFNQYANDWCDRERAQQFWEERFETGTGGELSELCIPRNRKNRYYNLTLQPIKIGKKIVGWLETMADVTTVRKIKEEYKIRERYISDIFDAFGAPVMVISYPDLKYSYINRRSNILINDILGKELKKEAILDRVVADVLSPLKENGFISLLDSIVTSKEMLHAEQVEMSLASGKKKIYKMFITPMTDQFNKVKSLICVGIDITEEIEFTNSREEFFTIISHELRSPTNIILAATQLLLMEKYSKELSQITVKHVHRIKQNSFRLLKLINNFLDIQRSEAGFLNISLSNIDIVNLSEEITSSVAELAESRKINLIFDTELEEKMISIDTEKYERILLNLLSNSIKFTKEDGIIIVSVSQQGDQVIISVKDNGVGIAQDKMEKIFQKFAIVDSSLTRGNEGTGLGLSLVKILVEKMSGTINVVSEEGCGTEFILSFPDKQIEPSDMTASNTTGNLEHIINIEFSDINFL